MPFYYAREFNAAIISPFGELRGVSRNKRLSITPRQKEVLTDKTSNVSLDRLRGARIVY